MIILRDIIRRIIAEPLIAAAGMPQLDDLCLFPFRAGGHRQEIIADHNIPGRRIQLHEAHGMLRHRRRAGTSVIQIMLHDPEGALLLQPVVQKLHRSRTAVVMRVREYDKLRIYRSVSIQLIANRQYNILHRLLDHLFCLESDIHTLFSAYRLFSPHSPAQKLLRSGTTPPYLYPTAQPLERLSKATYFSQLSGSIFR